MKTRRDDRRNTTRSAGASGRGRGAVRGRGRGSPVASPSRAGRGGLSASSSRGGQLRQPVGVVRGSPERRAVTGLLRSPTGRSRGRPPGRARGRGRGRGQPVASQSDDDGDDPSGEEEEEEVEVDFAIKEEEDDYDEEQGLVQLQQSAVSQQRHLVAGSSAESSTEADESGDDMLIDVLATADFGRSGRKRQLPARFRDAPLQPLVRRRTISTSSGRADRTPGSPEKEGAAPGADRSPVRQQADKLPARSPLIKQERFPTTIAEKLERQAAEEARAAAAAELAASPEEEEPPLEMDPLETLTDAIELDHGMHCAPPPASPPRKRQRLRSRSGDTAGPTLATEHEVMSAGPYYQEELVEEQGQVGDEVLVSSEIDEDDLITMELDPMEVPLPVEMVPRRPCKVCHRQFKVTNLKQHMLTHTGMRPFKCEICSAAFTRRSDVFRHVKILHQQEKPFKCVRDGKEFSDRKTLKAHMEQHKRPSLFACKVCDFRFGKFEYYLNHLKFIHPTGEPLPVFPEDVEPEPEPVAPPRGRYGPTPLQAYLDEDDDDSHGAGGLEHGMGEELQLGGGLESIETEEIPHDSMHLVAGGAGEHMAGGDGMSATMLPDSAVPDVVEGQDVVISAAGPAAETRTADKDEQQDHINFLPLEEDAAAILGMTDLALTNENTSLHSVAAPLDEQRPFDTPTSAPVVVLSGAGVPVRRFADPLISTRTLTHSQPRVVTIGKPVTSLGSGGPKTVLLTRPRMVAGKQILQAVKLGAGQKIVSARVPAGRGGYGGRQPIVRQVLINRPSGGDGGASRFAPRVVTTRVVRPATRVVPVTGTRTLASAAAGTHFVKTVSPAIRVVRPAAPPAPTPPPPPPRQQPVTVVAAEQAVDDTKNIEVTTSTASGSRTIILQTSGGGGDILQSEEAMQTLLEAVQQLVSASGDTLEGKQIEIVMQNDGQQGGAAAAAAEPEPSVSQ